MILEVVFVHKYYVKFNTLEKSLIMGLIFSILFSIVNFQSKCDRISKKVFRLHIIANSDSVEDQELKLKIRDRIIKKFDTENLNSLEHTKNFAVMNSNLLRNIALEEIIQNGFNYDVKVNVCKSDFNTRKYSNITLPAGDYDSLKIIIGDGKGKNWWCVLFPPMCLGAVEERVEDLDIFSNNEKKIIENNDEYEIKFKIIEVLQSVHNIFMRNIQKIIIAIKKHNIKNKIGNICSNLRRIRTTQSMRKMNQ